MTQQEVIKTFMARLANHGISVGNATAENMLNAAVTASSRFTGIQNVIDKMKNDQLECELTAIQTVVTEVLGYDWDTWTANNLDCVKYITDENGNQYIDYPKTFSAFQTALNSAEKKDSTTVTYNDVKNFTAAKSYTSLSNVVKELPAKNFLVNYCGIQLEKNY